MRRCSPWLVPIRARCWASQR